MPEAGADARAEQRGTLNRAAHDLQTAPELGALLEELRPFEEEHEPESFEAALIRIARRDYEKSVRVPSELRAELTRCGSRGYRAWLEAREAQRLLDPAASSPPGSRAQAPSTSSASTRPTTRTTCFSTTTSPG